MCIAGINATTQPCQHRWAHLVRPCDPARDLQTCPNKLQFSGWEQRHDTCPWCSSSAAPAHDSTHRLFGGAACPIAVPQPTDFPDVPPRRQRTGSIGTCSTLSRHGSINSLESEKGQRHRDQNDRLAVYLTSMPHDVLPSAKKYYPTYSSTAPSSSEDGSGSDGIGSCRRRESFRSSKRWSSRAFKWNRAIFQG